MTGLLRSLGQALAEQRPKPGQMATRRASGWRPSAARAAQLRGAKQRGWTPRPTSRCPAKPGPPAACTRCTWCSTNLTIFTGMGFEVVEGPEVEFDRYNFEL